MKKTKAPVSALAYKEEAKQASTHIARASEKLGDIARNLSIAPDFSPTTIATMRNELAAIRALEVTLSHMVDISVRRGCTHFDEQKEKLMEGNLKLNRREVDQAAE